MSADEVSTHNARVRRAHEARAVTPYRRPEVGDVWVSLGKRYEPDTSMRRYVLNWQTRLVLAI